MITLYGVFRSRATRPLWMLYETGTAFDHVPVIQAYRLADPSAADAPVNTASPAFLKVSPQGQIPVLQDGDLTLTESLAICQHIARRYGGAMAPQDGREQALADQWALFGATALEPPGLELYYIHAEKRADTPEGQAAIATHVAKLARPLARLDGALAGQDWLMGGRFTVADVMVAECLRYCATHPGLLDAYPAAQAWLARCQARPAFQKMWAGRLAEPM